jgi:3D (Asp-Asp-Asp) domain-containing protein
MTQRKIICFIIVSSILFNVNIASAGGFFLTNIVKGIFGTRNPTIQTVKFGMKNKDVTTVQTYLINNGFLQGNADGIFGNQTLYAVKSFQKTMKLEIDGIVGPKTFEALKNYKPSKDRKIQKYEPPKPSKEISNYSYTIPMVATAYTRYDEGCTDYTYRGNYAKRGIAAVDPNVIPLGTKLYIPGYGNAIADDIGGAIQGHRIDLFMETLDEAFEYGVRNVTVYIIK